MLLDVMCVVGGRWGYQLTCCKWTMRLYAASKWRDWNKSEVAETKQQVCVFNATKSLLINIQSHSSYGYYDGDDDDDDVTNYCHPAFLAVIPELMCS